MDSHLLDDKVGKKRKKLFKKKTDSSRVSLSFNIVILKKSQIWQIFPKKLANSLEFTPPKRINPKIVVTKKDKICGKHKNTGFVKHFPLASRDGVGALILG
jgi:hypothetical protein